MFEITGKASEMVKERLKERDERASIRFTVFRGG